MDLLVPGPFGARAMDWGLWRLSLVRHEAAVIPGFCELGVGGARSRYELSSTVCLVGLGVTSRGVFRQVSFCVSDYPVQGVPVCCCPCSASGSSVFDVD